MILLLTFIPSTDDCQQAYQQFTQHYNKSQSDQKLANFCENYQNFIEIRASCPRCIVTHIFDRNLSQMTGFVEKPKQRKLRASYTCQNVYCSAADPLPALAQIPTSVDLRTSGLVTLSKDQKQCGSCWAFATTGMLENVVLLDQKKIRQTEFAKNAKTLDLSDQFVLSNTFGFSSYCEGGDGVSALNFQVENGAIWPTLEVESSYGYDKTKYESGWMAKKILTPKISSNQYLLPYQKFPRKQQSGVTGTPESPMIYLMTGNKAMDIVKVKQYLARGMAVLATINTKTTSSSNQILASYAGDYPLTGFACSGTSDHQIVIVGYGKFKGVDVWIVRNSWGAKWGSQGHMYIEAGKNQFCIEQYAYAVIPKNYDAKQGVFTEQYSTPFSLVRGKTGLDKDDGSYINVKPPMSLKTIATIVSVVIAVIGVIAGGIFGVIRHMKNKK